MAECVLHIILLEIYVQEIWVPWRSTFESLTGPSRRLLRIMFTRCISMLLVDGFNHSKKYELQ